MVQWELQTDCYFLEVSSEHNLVSVCIVLKTDVLQGKS